MAGRERINPTQSYQEATNQLLNINSQRKNNIAEAKMTEDVISAQNNTMAQASELISTQQPSVVNASLNPATQNILGQYGLGQPKIQKTNSSSKQVTKENVVINNKNTTVTNNNVNIPNTGGPVQNRPIQFQDPNQIKFKSWLNNSFAQQNEMSEKRKREYSKRDSELTRSSNKLMRKLEETGKNIATSLNPKNMASNIGNQFKTLLLVLGFGYIAKSWPKLLDRINGIEKSVVKFFGADGGLSQALGGKPGETGLQALRGLFFDENDGILAYAKKWISDKLKERADAIKNTPFPDLSYNEGFNVERYLSKAFTGITGYLGDILSAILNPGKSIEKRTIADANKESANYLLDENENKKFFEETKEDLVINTGNGNTKSTKVSRGALALIEWDPNKSFYGLDNRSINPTNNKLTDRVESVIGQQNEISNSLWLANNKNEVRNSTFATGLSRLNDLAKEKGKIVVTDDFLAKLKKYSDVDVNDYLDNKFNGFLIVTPKTEEDKQFEKFISDNKQRPILKGILNNVGGSLGTTSGFALDPTGVASGLLAGAGYLASNELYKYINQGINNFNYDPNDYTVEFREAGYVPKDNETIIHDFGKGVSSAGFNYRNYSRNTFYELSAEDIENLIHNLINSDTEISLDNPEFIHASNEALLSVTPKDEKEKSKIQSENLYNEVSNIHEHKKEEDELADNLRAKTAWENISESLGFDKDWAINSANFESGDLSGVINASKKGVYYSESSASNNEGIHGPSSGSDENKKGYVEISEGSKGKCTSGPETYYYDGTGGKVDIRKTIDGKNKFYTWWDTGSPWTAVDSRLDKVGFKKIFTSSSLLKTTKDVQDAMKKKGLELKPGDIGINFGYSENPSDGHKVRSHAEMWNGEEWVSDYHQGNMAFVYGKVRPKNCRYYPEGGTAIQIWRYDNGTSKESSDSESEQQESGISIHWGENTFEGNSNKSTSYISTDEATFTPQSGIENDFPIAYNTNSDSGFNKIIEGVQKQDYTASLASMSLNLKTIQELLKAKDEINAHILEATYQDISALRNIGSTNTNYYANANSYDDNFVISDNKNS